VTHRQRERRPNYRVSIHMYGYLVVCICIRACRVCVCLRCVCVLCIRPSVHYAPGRGCIMRPSVRALCVGPCVGPCVNVSSMRPSVRPSVRCVCVCVCVFHFFNGFQTADAKLSIAVADAPSTRTPPSPARPTNGLSGILPKNGTSISLHI